MPGTVCGSTWEEFGLNPWDFDNVRDNENILYGVPGFDDFGQALLTVFQVCTLEGWASLMYIYADAGLSPIYAYIGFPAVVTVGSFFTLNLILAQIIDSYFEQQAKA